MTTHAAGWTDGPASSRHWLATAAHHAFPADDGGAAVLTGFAACALSADPHVAHDAREFTRATLTGWAMPTLLDDACVIVSELLSNALRYGVTGPCGRTPSPHPVWLGFMRRDDAVLVAVSDPGADIPVVKQPDFFAESGRGLHVIEMLSDSWGWTPPDRAGKAVWAVLTQPS